MLQKEGNAQCCPVAAIVRNGTILIGLRHYTPDKWKAISVWTLPGGRCDVGETIEQTLRREVAEETAICSLTIDKFLGEVPGAKDGDRVPVFLCSASEEPVVVEIEKFSEWKWCPITELPDNFINPHAKELILKEYT